MKNRILYLLATPLLLAISAGCHAQIPSNPTTYTCPTAQAVNTWTPLETAANQVTGTSTSDTPATGAWCYGLTSVITTENPIGQSVASNIVLVTTTAALPVVNLSWTPPSSGPTPTGYIGYRIAAIATTLGAPALSNPTTAAELVKPDSKQPVDAKKVAPPTGLKVLAMR
jgi:hypothetical protein